MDFRIIFWYPWEIKGWSGLKIEGRPIIYSTMDFRDHVQAAITATGIFPWGIPEIMASYISLKSGEKINHIWGDSKKIQIRGSELVLTVIKTTYLNKRHVEKNILYFQFSDTGYQWSCDALSRLNSRTLSRAVPGDENYEEHRFLLSKFQTIWDSL